MKHRKQKAFTLVELIVVVTILAILATIGFVSYSSYLTWVRDTNRIAQMTSLSDWLNLYSTTNDLPIPEDNVEVSVNSNLIAYQWYAGANILETINFTKGWLDPKDNTFFSYYLTRDRRYFQLMWFLEESADLTTQNTLPLKKGVPEGEGIFSQAKAVNLQDRIPTVSGNKLWILTSIENEPIQNLNVDIDIWNTTNIYNAYLTNTKILTWSWSNLFWLEWIVKVWWNWKKWLYSCKNILDKWKSRWDGVYTLAVSGRTFQAYCDMTTDWGGWTMLFNRKAVSLSIEDCWNSTNEFINGDVCWKPSDFSKDKSYSIWFENKIFLESVWNLLNWWTQILSKQFDSGGVFDLGDAFIVDSENSLFPNSNGEIRNIAVKRVCNLSWSCDDSDVYWKYIGSGWFYGSAQCHRGFSAHVTYTWMYWYCHEWIWSTIVSNNWLWGNRDWYNELKLWGISVGAQNYQEQIFIR